jgi:hypothetical protein
MTGDYTGRAAARGPQKPETEVERARAELVAALTEFEDKINIPKRIKRFRAHEPEKFLAAVSAVGTVAAGIVALGVVLIARRNR